MTNYEHYKKDIEPFAICNIVWAFVDGRFESCDECNCMVCLFSSDTSTCDERKIKWIGEEYKEPEIDWSEVPVDTKILVRDYEDAPWLGRHFAKCENGIVFSWELGKTSWTACGSVTEWQYATLPEDEE